MERVALLLFIRVQVYAEENLFNSATQNRFKMSGKKKTMRIIYLLMLTGFFILACDKPIESDTQFMPMAIIQTTTPKTAMQSQGIVSLIKVAGADLCYRFAYFTVQQQQLFVDVRAVGTYPTKPTMCAQTSYYKDTTLSIPTSVTGQYIVRFYNGNQLLKSDTVQVN